MNHKNILFFLFLVIPLLFSANISQTQNLYIEVYDQHVFTSISDVRVEFQSDHFTATFYTNIDGYVSQNVPAGRYEVTFSHRMYKTQSRKVEVPLNQFRLVDVRMERASIIADKPKVEELEPSEAEVESSLQKSQGKEVAIEMPPMAPEVPSAKEEPVFEERVKPSTAKASPNESKHSPLQESLPVDERPPVDPLTVGASLDPGRVEPVRTNDGISEEIRYRRSSIHLVLIETESFPKKDIVVNAYREMPFPDKYNDHTIPLGSFHPARYAGNERQRNALRQTEEENIPGEIPSVINTFTKETKLASQLVARWFNRQPDGSFDMSLVHDRGFYNATELEASIARGQIRGDAALKDAGEELIANTFVVFTMLNFIDNEPVARIARDLALREARKVRDDALSKLNSEKHSALRQVQTTDNQLQRKLAVRVVNAGHERAVGLVNRVYREAEGVAQASYRRASEGYSVWTTTWLYQLNWNENIAEKFYTRYWMDKNNLCPHKKELFDNSEIFNLRYIGSERTVSLVTFSLTGGPRQERDIIELSTVRNIDATLAKLQRKYDVFKPVVPVLSLEPLIAQIGMKEGLGGGERFEVLEPVLNQRTGILEYRRVATVRAQNGSVWDNRYYAGQRPLQARQGTEFSGSTRRIQEGMILRQIR